jgi:hypothetical protein
MIKEWQGPLTKPMGEPGIIHWHPVGDETLMPSALSNGNGDGTEGGKGDDSAEDFDRRVGSIDEGRERFGGSIDAKIVLGDTEDAMKKRNEMVQS